MKKPLILTLLVLVSTAALAEPFDAAMVKDMPDDVATYLDRAGKCWHWGGEEASDPARGKEIQRAAAKLKCDKLPQEETALRKAHPGDAAVLKRLDKAKVEYQ